MCHHNNPATNRGKTIEKTKPLSWECSDCGNDNEYAKFADECDMCYHNNPATNGGKAIEKTKSSQPN